MIHRIREATAIAQERNLETEVACVDTAIQTKDELVSLVKENQIEIQKYGIKRLGLFGSFVTERQGADSDVDLLVEFESGQKSFDRFMALSFFLENITGRRVDLVTTDALSPYLGPHIVREVEYVVFD